MASLVTNKVVNEIIEAGMFNIMIDEATDVSGKEQISIVIGYVDASEIIQKHSMLYQKLMLQLSFHF